jgi:hypothetical protein
MSLTLSTIREAIGAQLRANLTGGPQRQVNIDEFGDGKPAPVIRLELASTPNYWGTYGPEGIAYIEARLVIDTANVDGGAIRRLDDYLSVGTGNGESVVDALMVDQSFGGTVQGFKIQPGDYDADNATAELLLSFIAKKQGAEV